MRINYSFDNLVEPEDIYTISYTSGTTGQPKGAMISHKNVASVVSSLDIIAWHGKDFKDRVVHLSYLPLPHVFERFNLGLVVTLQGKYGLFQGDVLKLKEDAQILKPNYFAAVPWVLNKIYDNIKLNLSSLKGIKKKTC